MDIDALLDVTLDDLADMPEFLVFPAGAHKVTISFESKKIGEHPAVEMKMKAIQTIELADPADKPLAEGDETSVSFMLDNEFGQGGLKEVGKVIATHFGNPSMKLSEVIKQGNGLTCVVVTKVRKGKLKPGDAPGTEQKYTGIVSLSVA